MILLIDNYDSFVYNLYQLIGKIDADIKVVRNDEMTINEVRQLKPDFIILSPGPGKPSDAGICEDIIKEIGGEIPILGICLGHQAIAESFGAKVSYAKTLMHGKQSKIQIMEDSKIFKGLDGDIEVARYHSLAAINENFPTELMITAVTKDGEIMAIEHREKEIYGLQFHPESILTPKGEQMLRNFFGS